MKGCFLGPSNCLMRIHYHQWEYMRARLLIFVVDKKRFLFQGGKRLRTQECARFILTTPHLHKDTFIATSKVWYTFLPATYSQLNPHTACDSLLHLLSCCIPHPSLLAIPSLYLSHSNTLPQLLYLFWYTFTLSTSLLLSLTVASFLLHYHSLLHLSHFSASSPLLTLPDSAFSSQHIGPYSEKLYSLTTTIFKVHGDDQQDFQQCFSC